MKQPKRFKRSTILPLALLAYLAFMAYVGSPYFLKGEYLYYFGILGVSVIVIILLHFSLKRQEALKDKRENESKEYGTYSDDEVPK